MKINLKRESVKSENTQSPNNCKVETNTDIVTQSTSSKLQNGEVARDNLEKQLDTKSVKKELPNLTLYADTEYNQRLTGMTTTGIPLFCPELDAIYCCSKNELGENFNLISWLLEKEGYTVDKINRYQLEDKVNKLWKKKGYKSFNKTSYDKFIKEKLVINEFTKLGLNIENCTIDYSDKKRKLFVKFKSIKVNLQFFFAYADLFRIFGKDCQVIWYERAKLTQFRTIKIMGQVRVTFLVDGIPTDFNINIFDNRYCFPPRKGSLDGQAKTFGVDKYLEELSTSTKNQTIKSLIGKSKSKIKVSEQIKSKYGDDVTEQWCKENMDIVEEKYPDIHNEYAMMDCLVTWGLNQALNGMLAKVCELLEIEKLELSETCGKNIENILIELIKKHFVIRDLNKVFFDRKKAIETIINFYINIDEKNLKQIKKKFTTTKSDIFEKLENQFEKWHKDKKITFYDINRLMTKYIEDTSNIKELCDENYLNSIKELGLSKSNLIFHAKNLLNLISLGRSENLAQIDGNQFGIIPSTVVGGLLFTRTAKYPIINGWLFDLDLKSCYATALTSMSLYLGQPVHLTFKYDKPTLKRVVELIEKHNIPKDAWQIQASGMLKKATNTLVLSDSQFDASKCIQTDYKRYAMPSEIDLEAESMNLIDAEKPSEPTALSKIATKEINGGKFTKATLTALSDLPDKYYQEFLNLKVDAIIYYEPSMMCHTIDELLEKKANAEINVIEETLTENLQKATITKLSNANACLVFPIGKYYKTVADLRGRMKKAKEPVQEIFKLVLNSTYGILASLVMKVNNPIAANWITSCARAAAWRMTNALNGFNPITDGTAVNSKTIPFGMTFHEVLKKYPNYLENYQSDITNDIVLDLKKESDFNEIYIQHLEKFIGKSDWLSKMYAYDLKDEGNNKDLHYTKHYNTNAGNYLKYGKWGEKLKCRSYRATDQLQGWFKECCEKEYKRHLIYADKSILKLSQGSVDAIRILKDAENVANRDKNELRMPQELAEQVAVDGICHPMGFSKYEIKVMKLISISQFLPKDFRQMKILMSFYEECKNISKTLLPKDNWSNKLAIEKIKKEFPIITSDGTIEYLEYREELDYSRYNQLNPVGLGFELLIWGNRELKTLSDVRNRFVEFIDNYNPDDERWDIRAKFNWRVNKENLESNIYLRHFLAAVQIAKLNYEIDYRTTLANSVADPMSRVQFLGDITTLKYEKTKNL